MTAATALLQTLRSAAADGSNPGYHLLKRWVSGGEGPLGSFQHHQLLQRQCFHVKADNESAGAAPDLPGDAVPVPDTQAGGRPEGGTHNSKSSVKDIHNSSSSISGINEECNSATFKADNANPLSPRPADEPPSTHRGPRERILTSLGRRKRQIQGPFKAATNGGSGVRERGNDKGKNNGVVRGRLRGRAASICLKETASWLGAILQQKESQAASGDSAATAAIARLARGGGRNHVAASGVSSLLPEGAQHKDATHEPDPRKGGQRRGALGVPREVASLPAPVDPEAPAAVSSETTAAEVESKDLPTSAPGRTGRHRPRGLPGGPLGPPGAPDVSWGGAINFQFPVLFNVALKRLLKPLLRRARQQRRSGSRTAAGIPAAAAAAAAAQGLRSGQRPLLPPRALFRSWRPLRRAPASGGTRQGSCRRQQLPQPQQPQQQQPQQEQLQQQSVQGKLQQQAAQQQQQPQSQQQEHELQQDFSACLEPTHEIPTEQKQQQTTDPSRDAELTDAHQEDEARKEKAECHAVPVLSGVAESGAPGKSSEGPDGDVTQQEEGWLGADAGRLGTAGGGEQQQQQQHEHYEAPVERVVSLPPGPSRGVVGRGTPRAPPPRRSPAPMRFFRRRVVSLYEKLKSLMSPYCAVVGEWLYNNGNVVVTVGSLLSLAATLMADMRLLRMFNLLAGFCYFSYNWSRRPRLADAALWNVVFLVLNSVMLWRVQTEHREVAFSSNELDIFERYFLPAGMSPRQFRRLLRQGTWRTLPQGFVLQQEGGSCDTLCFVVRGTVEISQRGETVETHRGGETGAVVGVEPFLSYLAALRKHSATKSSSRAAATPPDTLASHADESPDALQQQQSQQQQVDRPGRVEEGVGTEQHLLQQTSSGDLLTSNIGSSNYSSSRSAATQTDSAAAAAFVTAGQEQHKQKYNQKLPLLNSVASGAIVVEPAIGDTAVHWDASGSIVAAAAEAAATAAAAMRSAAATRLLADGGAHTAEKLETACTLMTSAATPAAAAGPGVPLPDASAVQPSDSAAALAATTDAAASANAPTAAESTERYAAGEQQQRRGAAAKGEGGASFGFEGRLEDEGMTAPFTAICSTEATVFSLNVKEFAAFVLREPENLGFPVVQGLTTLLVNRSRAQEERIAIHSYDAFLAGVFADGVVQTDERKLLEEFRRKRAISQTQHEQALARLGWTPEEFERGSQSGTGVFSRIAMGLGAFMRGAEGPQEAPYIQQTPQLLQGKMPDRLRDAAAEQQVMQPLFEDWEVVEDAHAVPPHSTPETHQRPYEAPASAEAAPASNSSGDAVSYAFEEAA